MREAGSEKVAWPHAPAHRLSRSGTFIVTAGTYLKEHHFKGAERLCVLQRGLLKLAEENGWHLEAWAVFSNHYHFIAISQSDPNSLRTVVSKLHTLTARHLNQLDATQGRKVWFQYWDTHLTFERSYLARLNYVHHNPVKHGLVSDARQYSGAQPAGSSGWRLRPAIEP